MKVWSLLHRKYIKAVNLNIKLEVAQKMTENIPLEQLLGESAVLKILDVLMTHPSMDYSKKELAESAGVAESTVHRSWDRIQKMNAVKESRKYGKTQLYKLNQESEIVEQLFKLDQKIRAEEEQAETVKAWETGKAR